MRWRSGKSYALLATLNFAGFMIIACFVLSLTTFRRRLWCNALGTGRKRSSRRNHQSRFNQKLSQMVSRRRIPDILKAEDLLFSRLDDFRVKANMEQSSSQNLHLNHYSFGIIISAYAKCGDAVRAEKLLEEMERLSCSREDLKHLKPDTVKYTSCINAWAKSKKRGSAHKAERLLRRMEQNYYIKGDKLLKPNIKTYAAVIDAWGKNKERNPQVSGPRRAEDILGRMELRCSQGDKTVEPDIVIYNSVLNAWANYSHRERNVPQHAEAFLHRMINRYQEKKSNVIPDIYSYNILLKCWANSRNDLATSRCEDIFKMLKSQKSARANELHLRLNTVTYNTLLSAYLKTSNCSDYVVQRSNDLLSEMIKEANSGNVRVKPDKSTFKILREIRNNNMTFK